jgi:hypothetical protein
MWVILEFSGASTSPNDGVVQSATAWGELVFGLTVNLGAFSDPANATVAGFSATFGFNNHNPETGYTEVAEVFTGVISLMVEFLASPDTTPSCSSGNQGNRGGIAMEIAVAAAGRSVRTMMGVGI